MLTIFYFTLLSEDRPGKIDVFSFVLCTRGTPSLAPIQSKMQKVMVYKTAQVTWCRRCVIVAVLCFEWLYEAFICVRQSCWVHKRAPHWVRAPLVKSCTPKFDVFSFVLHTRGTPSLAPLQSKMQKIIVHKTAHMTWWCYFLVVVNLGFPFLYFALSLGVRQSRFASLLLPLALSLPRCLYCPHAVSTRTSHKL